MKQATGRPVSSAVLPSAYARQTSDPQFEGGDARERERSSSTTSAPATAAAAAAAPTMPRPRQISNDSLVCTLFMLPNFDRNYLETTDTRYATAATMTPSPPFKPVTMDQVMSSAGHDIQRALTELLGNFNSVLQERDHERSERVRMNNENSKLWNLWANLKREKEGLQRELNVSSSSGPSSSQRELRHLATRVIELETLLNQNGIHIPPSSSSRLSPSVGLSESEPRRPSPGSRSASDNSAAFRERQTSYQGQIERERANALTASASVNSFATAYSDWGSASRDREPERHRWAGAGTPPATCTGTQNSTILPNGQSMTASPQASRSREAFSPNLSAPGSMPPLSSSASTSTLANYHSSIPTSNPANLPLLQPRDKSGLATIPSTPVINDGQSEDGRFRDQHDAHHANPPAATTSLADTAHQNRSVASLRSERSDQASSEHLRIAKQSPVPVSPALSTTSSAAPSHISSAQSPRSPNPLHSPASSQHPHSVQDSPRSTSHAPSPLSHSASAVPRIISRKASSLDLARPDKISPKVPSRSATPPPDLGSPKQPSSPTQYAIVPPRTPGRRTSLDEALGSMSFESRPFGTPMQDMPDEARRYIMATDGGMTLPSPSSPFPSSSRAQTAADQAKQDSPHVRVSSDLLPAAQSRLGAHADLMSCTLYSPVVWVLRTV